MTRIAQLVCLLFVPIYFWRSLKGILLSELILRMLSEVVVPLAWPAVAITVIWVFRAEFREILRRVTKAGPTGFELSPQGVGAGSKLSGEVSDLAEDGDIRIEDWGYIQPWLESLDKHLERIGKPDDLSEIKRLAAANDRRAAAQFMLRTIFGTQYEALQRMMHEPQSMSDVSDLYEEHCRRAGDGAYETPESWLGWLTHNGFVYVAEGRYRPTDHGRSIVDLIVAHGSSARTNVG